MNQKAWAFLIVIGMAFDPGTALAETRPLTLEQCVEMGLKNSIVIHSSETRVEASVAKTREVKASRLPSLKFSAGYSRLSQVPPFEVYLPFLPTFPLTTSFIVSQSYFNNYSLHLGFQQPIFTGFRLQASSDMTKLNTDAAEQELTKDRNETIFAIQNAYWSLVKMKEFRKTIDENVEQVKAHLADVRNFFDQGLMTKNDILKVEVQVSSVQLAQISAKNAEEIATVWLNNLIGTPLDTQIEPFSRIEDLEDSIKAQEEKFSSLDKLLEEAQVNRPELKAMDLRIKAGEAGVTIAKAGNFPQVFLTGNYYSIRPNPRLLPTKDKFYDTWDISIALSYDIWNWKTTSYQTSQARAQLSLALDALELMKNAVAVEVRQNWLTFQESKKRIEVARKGVDQAEENLRMTRERFREGVALNSDVLDAEASLLQAKLSYSQALVDCELARARLQKAVGE